jgi:lipopolysaccharide exporter
MVLAKLLERSLGLISTIILARLLMPTDFGVVAMAMSVVGLLEVLAGFNFELALIKMQNTDRRHFDTAWTLNIVTWGSVALLMVLMARPVAAYYRQPPVELLLYLLAIGVFASGFQNIGIVAFQKDLMFKKDFTFLLTKKLIGATISISVAVIFRSYWALVAGVVSSKLTGVILSYFVHPFRPRLSLAEARALFHFSGSLLVIHVLWAARHRAQDFIIGRVAGPAGLAEYTIAFDLSNLPTSELVQPISRAVFPGYAKVAHKQDQLREGFLTVVSIIILFVAPAAAGIALLAEPLVYLLLGKKWLGVIPIIQVLAVAGLISALTESTFHLFIVTGASRIAAGLALVRVVILVPALLLGVLWDGGVGAAYGALVTMVIMLPLMYSSMGRVIQLHPREYPHRIWRPLAATGTMAASVALLRWMLSGVGMAEAHVVILLTSGLVGAGIYGLALLLLWHLAGRPAGAESHILSVLYAVRAKIGHRRAD